ncbi:MAG: hypothetical protein ING90_02195 [Rhodocyclaceae bacterium]|nr:hypothetical protein [Rhodocyclaceae bacterium]MCA3074011.1 hypothetical protein [Rhodocyclaceae bacterium]MCA3090689.1 hypothetical protein [Rhodocyclaceae bacterium]MCA3094915.1 hypothetical protein [Rhodocyclaceae bacterium]MCA3099258.1 hypothetical protein [Rhodocyclaceae bacterium]
MNVLSALGQPLNAEIELNATKDELSTMQVRIASADAYRRANLEFSAFVTSVRLAIEQRRDGSMIVRATTVRPVNEPFIELLVELVWSSGRLMREYTSLIDPPGFTAADVVAPPTAPPVAAARPAVADPRPVVAAPIAPETPAASVAPATPAAAVKPAPVARAAAEKGAAATATPGASEYGPVRRGETLAKIAESVRPAGVSLDQMLVSLYRENKAAFDGGNMNRLRTGAVLRVPDASALGATPAAEASREVRAQAADFNGYRQRLAGAVQDAPPAAAEGGQVASGRVTPRVEEKAPAPSGGSDVLRVSKGDPSKGSGRDPKAAQAAREEDATAREKALREANDRVASLEKMLKDAQRLLDIQSKQLADLQKPAKAEPAKAAEPAKKAEPAKAVEAPKPEPVKAEPKPVPAVPEPKPEPAKAEAKAESVAPIAPAAPPTAEPAKAEPPAAPVAPTPPVEAAKPKPVPPPPPPPPAPSLVDQAMEFVTTYLTELGLGLAALLGLGALVARRRKGSAPKTPVTKAAAAPPIVPASAPAAVATRADSFLEPTQASQIDLQEVDPLAEVEVYLDHGRESQAEEFLHEMIAKAPTRYELHLKLLEIYQKRGDAAAFEPVARKLYTGTRGEGAVWQTASRMGASIDPANPLYSSGQPVVAPVAPRATSVPVAAAAVAAVAATVAKAASPAPKAASPAPRAASPAPRAPSPAPRAPSPAPRAPSPAPLALDMEKTQILQVDDTALSEAPPTIDFDFEPAGALAPPAAVAGVGGLMDVEGAAAVPSGAAATDMDFTLDFGSPQTASAPPLPDLPLEAPSVGTQTAEADLTFEPIFPSSTGEEGLPTPLFQSEATNVLLDSGPPTGSILDFKREAALAQSELSAADTESGEPTQASLGQDTMIMANPGELVTFDMTHPAGLPQNWQEATLPRVDLDLGETQVDGSNPDRDEHWNDVNTKCDLAKAYEEMGDKDGAREILREVIAEGDAQQKADAEAMLARLG